jgi:hypothetical protein
VKTGQPSPSILDRLLTGELGAEESKWAVAHLLGRCEVCESAEAVA